MSLSRNNSQPGRTSWSTAGITYVNILVRTLGPLIQITVRRFEKFTKPDCGSRILITLNVAGSILIFNFQSSTQFWKQIHLCMCSKLPGNDSETSTSTDLQYWWRIVALILGRAQRLMASNLKLYWQDNDPGQRYFACRCRLKQTSLEWNNCTYNPTLVQKRYTNINTEKHPWRDLTDPVV